MIDNSGRDPSQQSGGTEPVGHEFTISDARDVVGAVDTLGDAPAADYFKLLQEVAAEQEYPDMSKAIERLSSAPGDTILKGYYEPEGSEPAELWARKHVAFALGRVLADLSKISQGGQLERVGGKTGTGTIDDLKIGDAAIDKELFVMFARILAQKPETLDSTPPTPDGVTDKYTMGMTSEHEAEGFVTLDGDPDKIVRFQKITVDSTVPGYAFVAWRHNPIGHITGRETDWLKLYLERR